MISQVKLFGKSFENQNINWLSDNIPNFSHMSLVWPLYSQTLGVNTMFWICIKKIQFDPFALLENATCYFFFQRVFSAPHTPIKQKKKIVMSIIFSLQIFYSLN